MVTTASIWETIVAALFLRSFFEDDKFCRLGYKIDIVLSKHLTKKLLWISLMESERELIADALNQVVKE